MSAPRRRPAASGRRALRLLTVYGAIGVATILVVVGGSAADPDYGTGRPWGGVAVDDLRSSPTETAWSLDLASLLAPEAPARCVHLWPSAAVDGLVAVTTSIDLDLEADVDLKADVLAAAAECRDAALDHRTSRVALVDVDTGGVEWVHDLVADVPDADPSSIPAAQVVPSAGRVVVQTQSSRGPVQAALDIGDGGALETARERRDLPSVSVATLGRLQLRTSSATGAGSDSYTLVDAGALSSPVWRGRVDRGSTPLLVPGALVVRVDGRALRVDGRTGETSPYGSTPDSLVAAPDADHAASASEGVFGLQSGPGGQAASALDGEGRPLWSSPLRARSITATPSCLLATGAEGDAATCLRPEDGAVAWTASPGESFTARATPGQTSDDVYTIARRSGAARFVALDGGSGRDRFDVPTDDLETVVAASRTVVYLSAGTSLQNRAVAAHDASSGRLLWTLRSAGTVAFWGGSLVEIDGLGVARRLAGGSRLGATS